MDRSILPFLARTIALHISVPSTDKLLDHALEVKGKPGLSMHLKILLGYKIKFEGLCHEGFC